MGIALALNAAAPDTVLTELNRIIIIINYLNLFLQK